MGLPFLALLERRATQKVIKLSKTGLSFHGPFKISFFLRMVKKLKALSMAQDRN